MAVIVFDIYQLRKIRDELEEIARKEAKQLFRLAWRALRHGCKRETVEKIREEARWLCETGTAYPERLLDPFKTWQYAFRQEGNNGISKFRR